MAMSVRWRKEPKMRSARQGGPADRLQKINTFVGRYNQDCKPFTWTAIAD